MGMSVGKHYEVKPGGALTDRVFNFQLETSLVRFDGGAHRVEEIRVGN